MATVSQKAMIHTLIGKLNIPDEQYREMLSVYGVTSSADKTFTVPKATAFIKALIAKAKGTNIVTSNKKNAPAGYATDAQKSMLLKMWYQISRQPSAAEKDEAFTKFVKNKFKIDNLRWLPSSSVPKIKHTLEAMGAKYEPATTI
jgi:hypothetical protein